MFVPRFRGRVDLPKKKYHSESGLNQRDRATCGFVQCQTNRKQGKKIDVRGFSPTNLCQMNFPNRIALGLPAALTRNRRWLVPLLQGSRLQAGGAGGAAAIRDRPTFRASGGPTRAPPTERMTVLCGTTTVRHDDGGGAPVGKIRSAQARFPIASASRGFSAIIILRARRHAFAARRAAERFRVFRREALLPTCLLRGPLPMPQREPMVRHRILRAVAQPLVALSDSSLRRNLASSRRPAAARRGGAPGRTRPQHGLSVGARSNMPRVGAAGFRGALLRRRGPGGVLPRDVRRRRRLRRLERADARVDGGRKLAEHTHVGARRGRDALEQRRGEADERLRRASLVGHHRRRERIRGGGRRCCCCRRHGGRSERVATLTVLLLAP